MSDDTLTVMLADLARTEEPPRPSDWPEPLPPHLSPSQVSDFLLCPEEYRLKRLVGLPTRPNVKLIVGHADTKANERNMRAKIDTGDMLSVEAVGDAAADAFRERVESDGGEGEVDWEDQTPGVALDKAVQVATVYRETVAPTVAPVAVEQRVELQVAGAPLVYGYADVVEAHQAIEKKTAATLTRVIQPQWRPAVLLYAAALERPVAVHVTTKAVQPKVTTPETDGGLFQPVEAERAARLVQDVAESLRTLVATRGPDESWPVHGLTHVWKCGLCDFRENGCWAWK